MDPLGCGTPTVAVEVAEAIAEMAADFLPLAVDLMEEALVTIVKDGENYLGKDVGIQVG